MARGATPSTGRALLDAETAAALAEKQELSAGEAAEMSQLWRKLVGDWHLLKSHEEYETMLERAERMPECFGMSAAFMGEEESAGGRRLARCEELIAFDCVAQPAAMPSGLSRPKMRPGLTAKPGT